MSKHNFPIQVPNAGTKFMYQEYQSQMETLYSKAKYKYQIQITKAATKCECELYEKDSSNE